MKHLKFTIVFFLLCQFSFAQVYIEKQTRHRFAQLTLGIDYQTNHKGSSTFLNSTGGIQSLDLTGLHRSRFLIGGTHFWGHADFYIAIPLFSPVLKKNNQEVTYYSGVETVFKFYPWRVKHNKVRPFAGISLSSYYFEQNNNNLEYGNGPDLNHTSFPLLGGLTYNYRQHLFEAGLTWNYANKQDYYISRTDLREIDTPPLYFCVSYKYMLETTLSAEKDWESGRTAEVTKILADRKQLNNFYFGVGLSSAFWLGDNSYNDNQWPFIERYSTALMADFTLGYYFHQPDLNIAMGYRSYSSGTNTYGVVQSAKRRSLVFEVTKFLFDYHGFAPFLGPAVSYENLSFKESFEGQLTQDISDNQWSYGLTFGWDIRPNRIQSWILRTNLRWFPDLQLDVNDNDSVNFNNIEFNFIQLIVYPGRMFGGD